MYINATLLVQAFHFFIAYVLLKKLLLRPAIAVIEDEQAQQDSLRAVVASRRILVQQKELERIAQWKGYQQEFLAKIPPLEVERAVIKGIELSYSYEPLSPLVRNTAKQLSATIVAKVDHVA